MIMNQIGIVKQKKSRLIFIEKGGMLTRHSLFLWGVLIMGLYFYNGPVEVYGKIVSRNWYGETTAPSKKKARSNLTYQWKKEFGYIPSTKVNLVGTIEEN